MSTKLRALPKKISVLVCVVGGSLLCSSYSASSSPFSKPCLLEIVEKIKVSAVAPSLTYYGVAQNINKLDSIEVRDAILQAYVSRWKPTEKDPSGSKVETAGRWLIVSKMIGVCLHTVQLDLRATKASGFISTLNVDIAKNAPPIELGKYVQKLSGSNVISDIAHTDPGKKARTLMLSNNYSPDANAEFYLRTIGADGWTIVSDHRVPIQRRNMNARALAFSKGYEQQVIVITEATQGSTVVIQWADKP